MLVEELKNVLSEYASSAPGGLPLEFTLSRVSRGHGDVPIKVGVAKLDKAWSNDELYIGPNDEGMTGRRERFKEFLKTGKPIEMSQISLRDDGRISFGDGRHRFAVLRDMGVDTVFVAVPRSQEKEARKALGA